MKSIIWNPDVPMEFIRPKNTKEPTNFLSYPIFLEKDLDLHGYLRFDRIYAMMLGCKQHNFYVALNSQLSIKNAAIAEDYYSLRSKHLGMRDLGRTIWGRFFPGEDIIPDWCFEWKTDHIRLVMVTGANEMVPLKISGIKSLIYRTRQEINSKRKSL